MRILILNWRDIKHPLSGGAEISLMEHAKYWNNKGEHVTWFASNFKNGKSDEELEGINIIRRGSQFTVHFRAFLFFLRGGFRQFDVVIDNFHFIPFFTPLYLRNKKILALINEPAKNVWFENIIFPIAVVGYFLEPLFFIFYKNIKFMTGSESIAEELGKNYKISKKHILVVHHGVTLGKKNILYKKEKKPTFIYASRISKDKGIVDAIKAFSDVARKNKDSYLWVVGKPESNEYLSKIKQMVKNLNIETNVKFFGFVSENKKFELLTKAWVLIHPSKREGWGLNVIEANSVGTPTIGYDVTGLRDSILNNKTGLLTTRNTVERLTALMIEIMEDIDKRSFLSTNALKWSKNFSWEKAGSKSYQLIKNL